MMPTLSLTEAGNRDHGFTLVEMLAVLTIIGLVAGVVAVRVGKVPSVLERSRIAGQVRTTILAAKRATMAAGVAQTVDLATLSPGKETLTIASPIAPEPKSALTIYPDGSSTGGTVTLGNTPLVNIDWLTSEVSDAPR